MRPGLRRWLFLPLGFLLFSSLACSVFARRAPTSPAPPGESLSPGATSAAPEAAGTAGAEPGLQQLTETAAPAGGAAPERPGAEGLVATAYSHPAGIFQLFPPQGWSMSADEGSVLLEAPDMSAAILVQVTNTARELEAEAFERFVQARDENFFAVYDGYRPGLQEIEAEQGSARLSKELIYAGALQQVVSVYLQEGATIFIVDLWAERDRYEQFAPLYDRFMELMAPDAEAAAEQVAYLWVYPFAGPDELFSYEVPTSWTYESTAAESARIDTFSAPDRHAWIQSVLAQDGGTQPEQFALELLEQQFAPEIEPISEPSVTRGMEQLHWQTPSGDLRGVSFFERRGVNFVLFSVVYEGAYEDAYLDVLEYTLTTFEIP